MYAVAVSRDPPRAASAEGRTDLKIRRGNECLVRARPSDLTVPGAS
jgi:hypothetical protein